jgi:homoserine dehydrogenase
MGGVRPARDIVRRALAAGKHVVTANKALLALHGAELFAAARRAQVDICFEASVCGGIPVLRALREGFVGNRIESLFGIVNGTCNYILTEMAERGAAFSDVLKRAQDLGYAEADPGFDVDGVDAAHKLAILLAIAHGVSVDAKKIYVEGIRNLSPLDFQFARRFGYEIRLLAIAKADGGSVQARVHPTMIPSASMLAAVRGVYNAVLIQGDFVGEGMLYGRGAGSGPTASSVVGDIVEVARNVLARVAYTVPPLGIHDAKVPKARIAPIGELRTPYYLRFQALDRPGVLARIASILSRHRISISSVYQHGQESGKEVSIVVLTHAAVEREIRRAIRRIDRLPDVRKKTTLIRVEETFK